MPTLLKRLALVFLLLHASFQGAVAGALPLPSGEECPAQVQQGGAHLSDVHRLHHGGMAMGMANASPSDLKGLASSLNSPRGDVAQVAAPQKSSPCPGDCCYQLTASLPLLPVFVPVVLRFDSPATATERFITTLLSPLPPYA